MRTRGRAGGSPRCARSWLCRRAVWSAGGEGCVWVGGGGWGGGCVCVGCGVCVGGGGGGGPRQAGGGSRSDRVNRHFDQTTGTPPCAPWRTRLASLSRKVDTSSEQASTSDTSTCTHGRVRGRGRGLPTLVAWSAAVPSSPQQRAAVGRASTTLRCPYCQRPIPRGNRTAAHQQACTPTSIHVVSIAVQQLAVELLGHLVEAAGVGGQAARGCVVGAGGGGKRGWVGGWVGR